VSRSIVVEEQDPIGDLSHVKIFMNDGPKPLTWDAQLLSYLFNRNLAVFRDSVLRHREVGRAKDLSAPPRKHTKSYLFTSLASNGLWKRRERNVSEPTVARVPRIEPFLKFFVDVLFISYCSLQTSSSERKLIRNVMDDFCACYAV
jgi:hypothetical protein